MDKNSKELSEQRYSQFAQNYVTSKTHAKGHDLDRLVNIAEPKPDWKVLDVATGGGHTALKFAPNVRQVIASDLTAKMLDAAANFIREQEVENIEFRQADAEELPFKDNMFDLVTCRIAPHHFPNADMFVSECARVLKPGGVLLVQDILLPEQPEIAKIVDGFEKKRDPSHHRAFSENEWRDMFNQAVLTVEHTETLVKRHDFLDWANRQGNTPETIQELVEIMAESPEAVREWMEPDQWKTPDASFVNHHLIIKGRKS